MCVGPTLLVLCSIGKLHLIPTVTGEKVYRFEVSILSQLVAEICKVLTDFTLENCFNTRFLDTKPSPERKRIMALTYTTKITADGSSLGWLSSLYEIQIIQLLRSIERTRTGGAVIWQVWRVPGKAMRIIPWNQGGQNAAEHPINWLAATPKGLPYLLCGGNNMGQTAGGIGTGLGSDTEVAFSPQGWGMQGAGSGPDEVLLHEMVHGLRDMRGKGQCRTNRMGKYDTEEEFFAILITNIYISEKNKKYGSKLPLRADHQTHSRLGKSLDTSMEFLQNPRNLDMVDKLINQHPMLAAVIAEVDCDFNPIAPFSEPRFRK